MTRRELLDFFKFSDFFLPKFQKYHGAHALVLAYSYSKLGIVNGVMKYFFTCTASCMALEYSDVDDREAGAVGVAKEEFF